MPSGQSQIRHKPVVPLMCERGLVLACPQFRSNVNLSRLVRLAGCAGVRQLVVCGSIKPDPTIARDAIDYVEIVRKRTLTHWLKKLRSQSAAGTDSESVRIVGLEQTENSRNLFDYRFHRKSVLVIGHERLGVADELLTLCHDVVEVPVYGQPLSYNVVTAATMAVYEYCRQFPQG